MPNEELTDPQQPLRVRLVLFLSSYSPLFIILAIRFEGEWLRVAMGGLAALGILLFCILLLAARRSEPQRFMVSKVDDRGGDVAAYIATYLLPLIVLTIPMAPDLVGYGIFLIVSGIVFVQSRMVAINPLVYATGRRILLVHATTGEVFYLINRRAIRRNEYIWTHEVLASLTIRAKDHSRKVGGWG